jgi:hypothetical protein
MIRLPKKLLIIATLFISTHIEVVEGNVAGGICATQYITNLTVCILGSCERSQSACLEPPVLPTSETTCGDLEGACTELSSTCCPECTDATTQVINCATDTTCPLDCSGSSTTSNPTQPIGNPSCITESIRLYTECILNLCPRADGYCAEPIFAEGDTCDVVEERCALVSYECCPQCADELTDLINCATQGECQVDCTAGIDGPPDPSASTTNNKINGAFFFMVGSLLGTTAVMV